MDRILRTREVVTLTGVSRVTLWRWHRNNEFPSPIRLGPNTVGWRESDVLVWLESRPRSTFENAIEPGDKGDKNEQVRPQLCSKA